MCLFSPPKYSNRKSLFALLVVNTKPLCFSGVYNGAFTYTDFLPGCPRIEDMQETPRFSTDYPALREVHVVFMM